MIKNMQIKWTVSRGRETYGWNICTATIDGKKYRCSGGGYDMLGTVVGMYIKDQYQAELLAKQSEVTALYGARLYNGKICIDGACGLDCMLDIAKVINLDYQKVIDSKGNITNILFEPAGDA